MLLIEVPRGHGVGVLAEKGLQTLVDRARYVQPAELVERRVDARVRRLSRVLRVIARRTELKSVVQKVRLLATRPALDREAGKVFGPGLVEQIECEQRLGVANVRSQRHKTSRFRNGSGHLASLPGGIQSYA